MALYRSKRHAKEINGVKLFYFIFTSAKIDGVKLFNFIFTTAEMWGLSGVSTNVGMTHWRIFEKNVSTLFWMKERKPSTVVKGMPRTWMEVKLMEAWQNSAHGAHTA